MRILHVTDCYLPRLGGIEVHVHDTAAQQRAAGHDARVLTMTPAAEGAEDPAWVVRVAGPGGGPAPAATPSPSRLRALLSRAGPEVVHVHVSVLSPFATLAAREAAGLGLPTLVTLHSLWSRLGPLPAVAGTMLGLSRWPVRWSAVSDRAAAPLRRVLGPDVPVAVLPNAVEPGFWKVDPEPPAVATIVSVMRLSWIKRPLPLARMLREVRARVPDDTGLRAVIIGDGPQRAHLERYLERHDMAGWVTVTGRLERAQIRDIFARSSLYVAPAELESFGIAALEARCAGLPVVASSRGGVGEFVTPGVEGLLADSDGDLVTSLVRLVVHDRLREAMTAHNRAVAPDLGWASASARTMREYRSATEVAGDVRAAARARRGLAEAWG